MRFGSRTLAALVLASATLPLGIGAGCGHGQVRETMVAPDGASQAQKSYDLGYRMGGRDRDSGLESSFARHKRAYDAASEAQFATGYSDGYSRAVNRYGSPEANAWMREPGAPSDND